MGSLDSKNTFVSRGTFILATHQQSQQALVSAVQCLQTGDLDAATTHCQSVLQSIPGEANALHVLGAIRLRQNDPETAIKFLTQARKGDPTNGEILANLGAAYRAAGQPDQAAEILQEAILLAPENSSAYFNLANSYVDAGNLDLALTAYCRVIDLVPAHVAAHGMVAQILRDIGDTDAALRGFEALDRIESNNPETLNAIAVLHVDRGQMETAEEFLRKAVSLSPDNHEFASNLANILAKTFRTDEALTFYAGALDNTPDDPDLLCNIGNAVSHRGDSAAARDKYRRALEIDPDHIDAHAGLANNLLADGKFSAGWEHFLRRTSVLTIASQLDRTPLAADLDETRVIVLADQGLGDQVFFARYLPEIRARGAHVTFQTDPRIADMLTRSGVADMIAPDASPADGDRVVSAGDLPYLLHSGDDSALPPPYEIAALPEREDALRAQLTAFGPPPWIGVTWRAGTPNMRQALLKEAPVALFASALRDVPGSVIVVQRDAAEGETDRFAIALDRPVLDLSSANDDIEDLLALSGLLDRYVGVSNTMTHFRAARQQTSDVIVPRPAEYRWMNAGEESPWFPGTKIYRQMPDGAWPSAFDDLSAALKG
ncbi:MAG: tetratricopeptide (TPR) repeat protein [Paracoccaceae bacterium]|jgi:tetratricopeptide (TPR) repeat protein